MTAPHTLAARNRRGSETAGRSTEELKAIVSNFLADRQGDESFATWVARADEELLRGDKVLVVPGLEAAS